MRLNELLQGLESDVGASFEETQKKCMEILDAVESMVDGKQIDAENKVSLHQFLDISRKSQFLLALPSKQREQRWVQLVLKAIKASGYTLQTMFLQRVANYRSITALRTLRDDEIRDYSWSWLHRRVCALVSAIDAITKKKPKVAILSANSIESACVDLACLFGGIFVSPLDIHFDEEELTRLFKDFRYNIAFADNEERTLRLIEVRERLRADLEIICLGREEVFQFKGIRYLDQLLSDMGVAQQLPRITDPDRLATVMFTSGSTGKPKGVAFTDFNILSKRFCRAAAVPFIGDDDIFLCYLPLYHTFGRFLELMGCMFWGAIYTFVEDLSSETLITNMQRVQPTVLISIPQRWEYIKECAYQQLNEQYPTADQEHEALHKVVGGRLRWGLSAAGYLPAETFRFFQRNGVDLCSGFGMTEATGGITMTPPGRYKEGTVGIPLPGIEVQLTDSGEMRIRGAYVAKYITNIDEKLTYKDGWLYTGDIFTVDQDGYYTIVDRVKDIYKNTKGQTIAPQKVESLFKDVPGFKRVFLVGDGKPYNTLLVVPDLEDDQLELDKRSDEEKRAFFNSLILSANRSLPPYMRIVNFAILNRDFSIEHDELTAKKSYKRKNIVKNFEHVIEPMYRLNALELCRKDLKVVIPIWLMRELGVTEMMLELDEQGLKADGSMLLQIKSEEKASRIAIGKLAYQVSGNVIDLGLFVRSPYLYLGNPPLMRMAKGKAAWELELNGIAPRAFLPTDHDSIESPDIDVGTPDEEKALVPSLQNAHYFCSLALLGNQDVAIEAIKALGKIMEQSSPRLRGLIRSRLETLAEHRSFEVRKRAYITLLFSQPDYDYSNHFPAFIRSGKQFLDTEGIEEISKQNLEQERLTALRQRLKQYRKDMRMPLDEKTQKQFVTLYEMLITFAHHHPEYYENIREEFASWILECPDEYLSNLAYRYFFDLGHWFESWIRRQLPGLDLLGGSFWESRIVFEAGIPKIERQRLFDALSKTTLLSESIYIIYDGELLDPVEIQSRGLWITRLLSQYERSVYKLSISTHSNRHYELAVVLHLDLPEESIIETVLWTINIASLIHGSPVIPRFGSLSERYLVAAIRHIEDLTLWERMRAIAGTKQRGAQVPGKQQWQRMLTQAIAVYLEGWVRTGMRILPGLPSPKNVIVPEADYRTAARIVSLAGRKPYHNSAELLFKLVDGFYNSVWAYFPWTSNLLRIDWLFDAVLEVLGEEKGLRFLEKASYEWKKKHTEECGCDIQGIARSYIRTINQSGYKPLVLTLAVMRYFRWEKANRQATKKARFQTLLKLYSLYRLDRFPQYIFYNLFKMTYFKRASEDIRQHLDRFILSARKYSDSPPSALVELSDLYDVLTDADDKMAVTIMVYPRLWEPVKAELVEILRDEDRILGLQTEVQDKAGIRYHVRPPKNPREVGRLYRLFYLADIPITFSSKLHHLVLVDELERVVGGLTYRPGTTSEVHLDWMVVAAPLRGKGLGSKLMYDFISRMRLEAYEAVTTHFYRQAFLEHHGFKVQKDWGGYVYLLHDKMKNEKKRKR